MRKIIESCKKELHILWRDKMALLLLFIMPLLFVFIITLVQSHSIFSSKSNAVKILLVNHDRQGALGSTMSELHSQHKVFKLIDHVNGHPLKEKGARKAVAVGNFQALIIIPKGATKSYEVNSQKRLVGLVQQGHLQHEIQVIFNPNIQPAVRQMITTAINVVIQKLQIEAMTEATHELLGTKIQERSEPSKLIHVSYAHRDSHIRPNVVQQNVPGWAIFGMFFIIVPLSATIIREKELGILTRIFAAPGPYWVLLTGKTITYLFINLVQLVLMLVLGAYILPLLGTPELIVGPHYGLVLFIGVATSLSAVGLGLLVGCFVKSYEQASVLGALLVVIAAAIGGIIVPNYLLPTIIQKVGLLSPLHWAHSAFIDIFVRHASLSTILPAVGVLFAIFVACFFFSSWRLRYLGFSS